MSKPTAEMIRLSRANEPKMRDRDLADKLRVREAELVAAFAGLDVRRIDPHPDTVMGIAKQLGDVMALTRNDACVHEKDGFYEEYHSGEHASMVLGPEIDLRMFPSHWRHAFMINRDGKKSVQVFDAAGDAVHKVFLRDHSDHDMFEELFADMALDDQSQSLDLDPRQPLEAAKSNPEKLDILRKEWDRLTDTHQFLRLVSKLKMNRLGAYRIAGAPHVRPLDTGAVDQALHAVQAAGIGVMIFVGNRGCIQIHEGPIQTLKSMGPWQNVLDPRFNLHLRLDKVAEVWAVNKPTNRGDVMSLEAFDAGGSIILQIFGIPKEGKDSRPEWKAILDKLDGLKDEVVS